MKLLKKGICGIEFPRLNYSVQIHSSAMGIKLVRLKN
jgi:hypothetical protein